MVLLVNARTFAPRNLKFRMWSVELSLPGTNVPHNFRSREQVLHGTFAQSEAEKLDPK